MDFKEIKNLTYGVNVVWIGTIIAESTVEDFEKWFLENYNYHIKYKDEFLIKTGLYKNLNCIIFSIPVEEVSSFSIFRLCTNDMKWLNDFYNMEWKNIPSWIIEKYNLDLNSKFYNED